MEFIADFHIHSKYSRATSKDMDIDHLSEYAKIKGIDLLGTGDFTHHLWLEELKAKLRPKGNGLFEHNGVSYILTAEVNNMFRKGERGYRMHNILFAPGFDVVDEVNRQLAGYGKLASDGRPILSMGGKELVRIVLSVSEDCFIIPGHIWTPWFSLFGSKSGFDAIEDCFEEETSNIYALETGLSSDPATNWRWSALDRFSLISNSDSHSPTRIGREANIFDCKLDYHTILDALKTKDKKRFLSTIEFFPHEGKYHYDGHRLCNLCLSPEETRKNNGICPKCGKPLTVGVMHRVEALADRPDGFRPESAIPFQNLIPLDEIIAEAKGVGKDSKAVMQEYRMLIQKMGSELDILRKVSREDLLKGVSPRIAEGILRVREGKVKIHPGYDGVYGRVEIFGEGEKGGEKQLSFF